MIQALTNVLWVWSATALVFAAYFYVKGRRLKRRQLDRVRVLVHAQAELNRLFSQGCETYRWVTPSAFDPAFNDGVERPLSAAANEAWRNAHHKSMELLKSNLTPAQLDQFKQRRFFDVLGSHSGRRYRIDSLLENFNVFTLDDRGNPVDSFCFAPQCHVTGGPESAVVERLPKGDVMLTQKIYLENFEDEVWRVANQRPVYPPDMRCFWHVANH